MSENIEIQVMLGTKSNLQPASDCPVTDPASGKVGFRLSRHYFYLNFTYSAVFKFDLIDHFINSIINTIKKITSNYEIYNRVPYKVCIIVCYYYSLYSFIDCRKILN